MTCSDSCRGCPECRAALRRLQIAAEIERQRRERDYEQEHADDLAETYHRDRIDNGQLRPNGERW
jgi:hypothetical protein